MGLSTVHKLNIKLNFIRVLRVDCLVCGVDDVLPCNTYYVLQLTTDFIYFVTLI